jgi:hypothetical protein
MEHLLDEVTAVLERLTLRISELENRVSNLERAAPTSGLTLRQSPATHDVAAAPQLTMSEYSVSMPAVGRVFLGIAGAYVLRAIAESSPLPQLVFIVVALLYAAMWLVSAARARGDIFVSTAYSVTAALIFAPLLWEVTLRFKVLPAEAAAAVLVGFMALASALAWKRNLTTITLVVSTCSVVTALILMIATRRPAGFIVALVAMALISEVSPSRERWSRAVVPAVCDLALLVLLSIYTDPSGLSPEYRPLPSVFLLSIVWVFFLIYAAVTAYCTLSLRQEIGYFEIAQTVVAFLLAFIGTLRVSYHTGPWLGAFCLAGGIGAYAPLIRFQHRFQLQPWTYHVFATWAVALSLIGVLLTFPAGISAILWGVAALVAILLSMRTGRLTPAFHGVIYIAAAVLASGLLGYGGRALIGNLPPALNWQVTLTASLAIAAYFVSAQIFGPSSRHEISVRNTRDEWKRQLQRTCVCVIMVFAILALLVYLLAAIVSQVTALHAPLMAILRTVALSMTALGLALAGARWQRSELVWTGYAVIALCTLKLLFEDIRNGTAVSIAVSFFVYGMVWVLVPRIIRMWQRHTGKA